MHSAVHQNTVGEMAIFNLYTRKYLANGMQYDHGYC